MEEPLATSVASCPECGKLRASLDEALGHWTKPGDQDADLTSRSPRTASQLNRNSSNSSSPPSADPLGAPKPVVKTPTGRKPGGQPGHQGHHRLRLPPERVNQSCRMCRRSARTAKLPCPPSPRRRPRADLASGCRTPRAGGGHHRAPRSRTHLPLLWLRQSRPDPPGDPPPRHRATLGCGDVLLQQSSSHWPSGGGGDRRDGLRGADLPGFHRYVGSRDEGGLGQSL